MKKPIRLLKVSGLFNVPIILSNRHCCKSLDFRKRWRRNDKKGCHGEALEPCGVAYPLCIALVHWRCASAHMVRVPHHDTHCYFDYRNKQLGMGRNEANATQDNQWTLFCLNHDFLDFRIIGFMMASKIMAILKSYESWFRQFSLSAEYQCTTSLACAAQSRLNEVSIRSWLPCHF